MLQAPTLLIQGAEDPYGTLAQIDRIEARARGPVQRLVSTAATAPSGAGPRSPTPSRDFLA